MIHVDRPRPSTAIEPEAVASPPAPAPAPAAAPPAPADLRPAGSGLGPLILTGLIALGGGLGGAYLFNHFSSRPRDPDSGSVPGRTAVAASAESAHGGAEPSAGTPDDPAAPSNRQLNDRIVQLQDEIEKVQKALDKPPKATASPEVASLQVRVADLTEAADNLAPLPGKVDHVSNRLSELSGTLNTVRDELTALQSRLGRTSRLASSGPSPRADRPVATVSDTDRPAPPPSPALTGHTPAGVSLERGAELFRKGRYKEAQDVFNALELSDPNDARVWYYAALCNGFATKDWVDSSARLVEEGIDRERAGTPTTAVIDDEFDDLTTVTGKDWLATYRKRVDVGR